MAGCMNNVLVFALCMFFWGMPAVAQDQQEEKPTWEVPNELEPATTCVPACRRGYICVSNVCVSECNPPCPSTQACVNHECIKEKEVHAGSGGEPEREGIVGTALLGLSLCVPHSSATCNGIGPGFGMSLGLGYRFIPYIGINLDALMGMYTVSGASFAGQFGVIVGPRIFLPLGPLDLYVGIGIGWSLLLLTDTAGNAATANGFGLGVSGGVDVRIGSTVALGFGFKMTFDFAKQACATGTGGGCVDTSSGYALNTILGLILTW